MDFATFFTAELPRILRKYLFVFLALIALAVIVTFIFISSQPAKYEATTKLLIGPGLSNPTPDLESLRIGGALIQTYAEIAESRPILQMVIAELDLELTPEELNEMVDVSINEDTRVMTIVTTSTNEEQAIEMANSLANVLVAVSPSGDGSTKLLRSQLSQHAVELEIIIVATEEYIQQLDQQLSELELASIDSSGGSNLDTFDRQEYLRVRLGDLRIQLSYALRAQAEIYNVLKEQVFDYSDETFRTRELLVDSAENFDETISEMEAEVARLEEELASIEQDGAYDTGGMDINEQRRVVLDQLSTERDRLSDALLAQTKIVEILERTVTNEVVVSEPAESGVRVENQPVIKLISAALAGLVLAGLLVWAFELFREKPQAIKEPSPEGVV